MRINILEIIINTRAGLLLWFTVSVIVCLCMSMHVCPGESFILDSRSANFWEINCPFGFLRVVF